MQIKRNEIGGYYVDTDGFRVIPQAGGQVDLFRRAHKESGGGVMASYFIIRFETRKSALDLAEAIVAACNAAGE